MIDRGELLRVASAVGLRPNVVEKDYVLGWVLHAINQDPELGGRWVFKGGTCLKKCYFETYRFSEDLDFTCRDEAQLNAVFLQERFRAIGAWLYDATGIELPPGLLRFQVWDNARGRRAGEGRLAYRGPIAPRGGDLPRIKLDLTADEALVLPPDTMPIAHPYSDAPAGGMTALCYAYAEVFGEKVRALGERARPRDLYDVVNLFRNGDFAAAAATVRDVLLAKCRFKGIAEPTLDALARFRDELSADWATMLAHQLPSLPPVEAYWAALPEFFAWLGGAAAPAAIPAYPLAQGESVLRAPAGALPLAAGLSAVIESIRFAGANRLLVELDYADEQGRRSTRTIESYSLRRTRDGNVVLHAIRSDDGQHRSYRTDRVRGARITSATFAPRYAIELTPSGQQRIPDTVARAAPVRFGVAQSARARARHFGLTHVFRCPMCGKKFERQSYDAALRPHKDRAGWDCSGRTGFYEGTK